MRWTMAAALTCMIAAALPAAARGENRWVTFKVTDSDFGKVDHQIDRDSIRQEGAYRTFHTRMLSEASHNPLTFSFHEALFFPSQKFAVDCTGRKFGRNYLESNEPHAHATPLGKMTWVGLSRYPAVGRMVCGFK